MEVRLDQFVLFKCSIPHEPTTNEDVRWRKNGKNLPVKWIQFSRTQVNSDSDEGKILQLLLGSQILGKKDGIRISTSDRFVARQASATEFELIITQTQASDDNSTFTCLHRDSSESESALAHESEPSKLRVLSNGKLDVNLAAPIQDLAHSAGPHQINQTTPLEEPKEATMKDSNSELDRKALKRILADLYEVLRPTLAVCCLVLLLSLSVAQLVVFLWRRRSQYKKHHHHHHYSAGSGSSATSSVVGSSFDCDPVLKSLMGRTLSAPMTSSSSLVAGASKKYRSYRDHLRKVAAASDQLATAGDLVDGLLHYQQHANQLPLDQSFAFNSNSGASNHQLPNLYNQSLAAREQARSLLKATEHMRSLSNLNSYANQGQQHGTLAGRLARDNGPQNLGSHLNLHLNLANLAHHNAQQQQTNSQNPHQFPWASHVAPARTSLRQQQQQQQPLRQPACHLDTDQSQLMTSSTSGSSHSPSSNSSLASTRDKQRRLPKASVSSSNHYSTIENVEDEDDECRYEELEPQKSRQAAPNQRLERGFAGCLSVVRPQTSSSNHLVSLACGETSQIDINDSSGEQNLSDNFSRSFGSKQICRQTDSTKDRTQLQDQLSPYAVSSICESISSHRPPVSTEAMRALNEQFNVSQLMLLDEPSRDLNRLITFGAPPPPPSPPPMTVSQHQGTESEQ